MKRTDGARRIHDRVTLASFILGALSLVFPLLSVFFLVTANGGPGYLQSLVCGAPVALAGMATGIAALAQKERGQHGKWMAACGVVSGISFFIAACLLVTLLLAPFLTGAAR